MTETDLITRRRDSVSEGIGTNARRPDGWAKVSGSFAFSTDLYARGMLWGRTLRAPYAAARINYIDTSRAERMAGVAAVVTQRDVPGKPTFGLHHADQPVFGDEVVRYQGEPIAAVAAEHPELALRAISAIEVEYEPLEPLTDPEVAIEAAPIHPDGNVFRHLSLRHGDQTTAGEVVVEGNYEVGMQDQAFLGPESGLAIPSDNGGVELFVSTQWLHPDQEQIAACLAIPREHVRVSLAGVGGAFGAREDLSLHVHVCLLALRTGRPVKMLYSREESFFAHVHRHPARMWYRHHADREGTLIKVEARLVLDGGAYASSSRAVLSNAVCFAAGPYRVPNASIDGWSVRTNNPPCGAMRGFGAVQSCFAYESQMDKLAASVGMSPVELRLRNALRSGDQLITGQVITGTAPVREVIEAAVAHDPPPLPSDGDSPMLLPGGAGRVAQRGNIRRGVGIAVGFKNIMFSEGADDYSVAKVRLERDLRGAPVATVHCAAAELGQGFVTIAQQIVRSELGVERVVLSQPDTNMRSAGSTSASRQTWMSGGAVKLAAEGVGEALRERAGIWFGNVTDARGLELQGASVRNSERGASVPISELLRGGPIEVLREYHHPATEPLDEQVQGNAHVSFAFAAHRAVVDVDSELGLVRVLQIATGQDVGRALNPQAVVGQIEGGIAQGLGLAVMEEIVLEKGQVVNPSFTDYLIPTALDMPEIVATLVEQPEPSSPLGAKGVGEAPTISSTPAIVAAIRNATGLELSRVPVRLQDIALAQHQRVAEA